MSYFSAIKEIYPDITREDFELWDEGQGPFIKRWNYAGGPIPNLSSLAARAAELSTINTIRNTRLLKYPPIGDQLDAILKQLSTIQTKDPALQDIISKWQAVKIENPFPTPK